MRTIIHNKLIRDKIPDIIKETGKQPIIEVLSDEEYKAQLDAKLSEELKEYLAEDSVEELADLVEVVYAILKFKGTSIEEFEEIRRNKACKRGGFEKRLFLKEVREID